MQNSADSVEQGIDEGLIQHGHGTVAIDIYAPSILLAIGGSTKRGTGARGFRGVGRLSGIAYCKGLRFRTRADGEDVVSIVEWDCKRLRQRLSDGSFEGDLHSVITSSVTYTEQPASDEDADHFFEVTMLDVARHRGDSSRITSLIGEATLLFKWRINVSSVRTLMRAMARETSDTADVSLPRSVTERRIERRRPSGNRTTTKAGPRADWAETSSRRCPARP